MMEDIPKEERRKIELENATLTERSLMEISDSLSKICQLLEDNFNNQKST